MALYLALVHYPVLNKHRRTVATSISNFDIHDLARLCKTYGLERYFIVNPIPSQQWFAQRVITHWREGFGAHYNPTRQEAMELIQVRADINEVAEEIHKLQGDHPLFVATSARRYPGAVSFAQLRHLIQEGSAPYCLVLGTGWGLHPLIMEQMDMVLTPIEGMGEYNHLSVRAAASIILDRLLTKEF